MIYFSFNFINNLHLKHYDIFKMYLILIRIHQHSNIIIIISNSINLSLSLYNSIVKSNHYFDFLDWNSFLLNFLNKMQLKQNLLINFLIIILLTCLLIF